MRERILVYQHMSSNERRKPRHNDDGEQDAEEIVFILDDRWRQQTTIVDIDTVDLIRWNCIVTVRSRSWENAKKSRTAVTRWNLIFMIFSPDTPSLSVQRQQTADDRVKWRNSSRDLMILKFNGQNSEGKKKKVNDIVRRRSMESRSIDHFIAFEWIESIGVHRPVLGARIAIIIDEFVKFSLRIP